MKKLLSIMLFLSIAYLIAITALAAGQASEYEAEVYTVPEALADPEVLDFLMTHGKLGELYQAQEEIRAAHPGAPVITDEAMKAIAQKYGLEPPQEADSGVMDNGTIVVRRGGSSRPAQGD